MATINAQLNGFTIVDIEESYYSDSVFTGTFTDA